jgi:3-phenylpropionate/trans-cinnamate dioxygenase ferredoxin reductase component
MSAGIVIAGGGLAAQRCAEALRRAGYDGPVRMICAEPRRPYDRPPLSKAVLAGDRPDLAFRSASWYADHAVDLLFGVSATALEAERRVVWLSSGGALRYDRLLIATGSRPRTLALLDGYANVTTLRTLDDARVLRGVLRRDGALAVVGAGFIGQEVAAAAVKAGLKTTVIEAAPAPLDRVVGREIGGWFADLHRANGVDVHVGAELAAAHGRSRVEALELADGRRIGCDHVVLGVGVDPDVAWLAGSGLDPTGVRVDAAGRTGIPGVFAAGDAAATYDPALGRHVAGGHWEAAARQGAAAARAMLGLDAAAPPAASFWSDLYDTRVQYLGHARLADRATVDGDRDARDFTVTFSRGDRPVAVLLVGRPHLLPEARALLAA